jgi:hypothetical protein
MMREQQSLEPLMTALRTAREKLLAIGSERMNEKQVISCASPRDNQYHPQKRADQGTKMLFLENRS